MKTLRSLSGILGIGCLILGLVAGLSGGGTVEQVVALGRTLVIAGAIILAGAFISSAIAESNRK